MKVALFIPCYVDQFYPNAAKATLRLLRRQGLDVDFPIGQTCCGQPMANSGCNADAESVARHYVTTFRGYDYVVSPSGSCTSMIRNHYGNLVEGVEGADLVRQNTYELCEFLTDVLPDVKIDAEFPHTVCLHQSCHGLRELGLGNASETMNVQPDKVRELLRRVSGLTLVEAKRRDECCGFGGTFAVAEEAVSCAMGNARIADYRQADAEVITATDLSCLMHLEGLIARQKLPLRTLHVAEILCPQGND